MLKAYLIAGACSKRRTDGPVAWQIADAGVMTQSNQLGDYLRHLTPQARSSLLIELERLEVCGAAIPGAAAVLEKLRAEFRKGGQTNHRVANPSRHFFLPLEPMLVDGAPEHDNCGHILRGSLAAIWEWISHDLLPTMASDYAAQMRPLIASDNQAEIRKVGVKRDMGTQVEVDSRVKAGDQVILNPRVNLADGSKVQVRTEVAAASGG